MIVNNPLEALGHYPRFIRPMVKPLGKLGSYLYKKKIGEEFSPFRILSLWFELLDDTRKLNADMKDILLNAANQKGSMDMLFDIERKEFAKAFNIPRRYVPKYSVEMHKAFPSIHVRSELQKAIRLHA